MLKKVLKRALAVALTVATVVTASVPVGAAALKPKKSHSNSEVRTRAEYLIEAADELAFSPYSKLPADLTGATQSDSHTEIAKRRHSYRAYRMCDLLLTTPNLKSACSPETISELKKARKTWQSAYMSDLMYSYYSKTWYNTNYIVADKYAPDVKFKNSRLWNPYIKGNIILRCYPDSISKRAKDSYNKVKKYIDKYKKYNPTAASKFSKWNTAQYNAHKKLAKGLKGFTEAKFLKCPSPSVFDSALTYYNINDLSLDGTVDEEFKLQSKISNWYWCDMGMTPFNGSKNSPLKVFMRNTSYTSW